MSHLARYYQIDALRYCFSRPDPALYLQMRLGKTPIAIWATQQKKRILVVAPMSALFSWEEELKEEGETDYTYLMGTKVQRERILQNGSSKWYLFNKEGHRSFRTVTGEGRRRRERWDDLFVHFGWDAVIIDESTCIKNPRTSVSKCYTINFRDVPYRMIMSGLPNPEGPLDFFQQFLFLDGGETLGSNYWMFRQHYYTQIFRGDWVPKGHAFQEIADKIGSRTFVRQRKDVHMDMPMVFEKRFAVMPPRLRKAYKKAEDDFVLEYGGERLNSTIYKIAVYHWLRHMASGFIEGKLVWPGKINLLLELLEGELRGEPIVIWFDYNEGLDTCRRYMMAHRYNVRTVYKTQTRERRNISLRDWQNGHAQLLLAQPRLIQFGTDLSRADTQIFFTSPLSGELRTQALERIWKPKTPVLCLDFVARNTIDEDVVKLLHKKNRDAVRLLDACSLIMERRKYYAKTPV